MRQERYDTAAAGSPLLTARASETLERRAFTTVAAMCCAYSAAVFAVSVHRTMPHDNSSMAWVDVEHESASQTKLFFSALLPPLAIVLAINLFLSALHPNRPERAGTPR